MMASYATDMLAVPVLLSEVKSVEQEDERDIGMRDEAMAEILAGQPSQRNSLS